VPAEASAEEPEWGARTLWLGLALGAVLLGAVLRILAAGGDLWLDEIWSLEAAKSAGSALGVFTSLHVDNNHYLNTLFLRALGQNASPFAYRSLSLAAGIAALALAVRLGRKSGPQAAAGALVLATSPLLVVLSSEARGYAIAVASALGALVLLDRSEEPPSRARVLSFGVVSSLGFLGHLGFAHVWLGSVAATAVRARKLPRGKRLATFFAWHALTLATLALLWIFDLSALRVGGGDVTARLEVLERTAALALGIPEESAWTSAALALFLALLGVALLQEWRRDRASFALFFVGIVLSPAAFLAASSAGLLYPRYFAVPLALAFLLFARLFADSVRQPGGRRVLALTLLLAIAIGGVLRVRAFLDGRRGRYSEAVRTMSELTKDPLVTVGSDHDFRNETVLKYTAERLGLGKRFFYVPASGVILHPPEWLLVHVVSLAEVPAPTLQDQAGHVWSDRRAFRYGGISGWSWYLYRRASGAPAR
jgi:uncharacterized membrane protein